MKIQADGQFFDRSFFPLSRIIILYLMVSIGWAVTTEHIAFCNDETNPEPVEYGIPRDSYQVVKDVMKRNQNLSKILLAHNVPYAVIDAVAKKSKNVFDVRKFKAGNPYSVFSRPGSDTMARYFVYEQDPVHYVVYNLADPDVYLGNKPVEIRIREASGVINGSLCQTFSRLGLEYKLVEKLSGLYAWTIDFHHLQKGDGFKMIYEQECVDETPIGLGKILAAKFTHMEVDHYAFYFEQGGRWGYYDENANSMQKAFLKAPLKYTRITSRPSKGRLHPILKIRRRHLGTDYAAPMGTPVYSVGDGIVTEKEYHRARGKSIAIQHSGIYKSEYLHLSKFMKGIKTGKRINRGEIIGYVGKTGLATGPHLEFRFWKNDRIFDHINKNLPTDKSLKQEYIPIFQQQTAALKARLNSIQLSTPTSESKQMAEKTP